MPFDSNCTCVMPIYDKYNRISKAAAIASEAEKSDGLGCAKN